jgi:S-adenosylmethionine hydrolase
MPIITLTTDFGLRDPFVGVIKGVIYGIAPTATLVDLTHEIPPQNIMAGTLALESVLGVFARDTIHLAVVDPGVGSSRPAIAIETDEGTFVGPDNGIFSLVLQRAPLRRAVRLTNPCFHRKEVSATFHGRDIFAPVAAHLSRGVSITELGEAVPDVARLEIPEPEATKQGLDLHVVGADRFGNVITNLTQPRFHAWLGKKPASKLKLRVGSHLVRGLRRTYAEGMLDEPIAYFGSTGRMEIAVRNANAVNWLAITPETVIQLSAE